MNIKLDLILLNFKFIMLMKRVNSSLQNIKYPQSKIFHKCLSKMQIDHLILNRGSSSFHLRLLRKKHGKNVSIILSGFYLF